jgi:hypothetical protein
VSQQHLCVDYNPSPLPILIHYFDDYSVLYTNYSNYFPTEYEPTALNSLLYITIDIYIHIYILSSHPLLPTIVSISHHSMESTITALPQLNIQTYCKHDENKQTSSDNNDTNMYSEEILSPEPTSAELHFIKLDSDSDYDSNDNQIELFSPIQDSSNNSSPINRNPATAHFNFINIIPNNADEDMCETESVVTALYNPAETQYIPDYLIQPNTISPANANNPSTQHCSNNDNNVNDASPLCNSLNLLHSKRKRSDFAEVSAFELEESKVLDSELFVQQPVDNLLSCAVCLGIVREPLNLSCSHLFCSACVSNLKNSNCPSCRTPYHPKNCTVNHAIAHLIANLTVKCCFYSLGCKETYSLGLKQKNKENHEKNCRFRPQRKEATEDNKENINNQRRKRALSLDETELLSSAHNVANQLSSKQQQAKKSFSPELHRAVLVVKTLATLNNESAEAGSAPVYYQSRFKSFKEAAEWLHEQNKTKRAKA